MKRVIWVVVAVLVGGQVWAQQEPEWDYTASHKWPAAFQQVEIPSTVDGKQQKAFIYKSKRTTPQPLIVSLHTWSGDYSQRDPLVKEILARDWNYVHPDFRGPNRTAEAMGSGLVIQDIEDAIRFALTYTQADPEEVHIIGVSGGGLATLAAYMNLSYPVKSFSAWAPISDLEAWYWESVGRKQKYAQDILQAISTNGELNKEEAQKRSPLKQAFPIERRKNAKLYIYEGIHDGYTGSVPITHALRMYNRLVGELKYGTSDPHEIQVYARKDSDLVAEQEMIRLLTRRVEPDNVATKKLFGRKVHLFRSYGNIQLTIFEGGHEQLPQALGLVPYNPMVKKRYNVLIIGDSNGQIREGWAEQLKKMLPEAKIVNLSQSGRTIGFDNNGREKLNALKHIEEYLEEAAQRIGKGKYDYILLCLGTNDTKKAFAERQEEVIPHFEALLDKIRKHKLGKAARLVYITPPPIRTKDIQEKYEGGNERLAQLIPRLKAVALQKGFLFVDIYHPLQGVLDYYATDGVHMAGPGQEIVALCILEVLFSKK